MFIELFDLLCENIVELFCLVKFRLVMFCLFFRELNSDSECVDYLKCKYFYFYFLLFDVAIELCIKCGDIKLLNLFILYMFLLGFINILINLGLFKFGLNFVDE